jgi:hypothetical protein
MQKKTLAAFFRGRSVADDVVRRFRNLTLDPAAAMQDIKAREPFWAPSIGSAPDEVRECVLPTLVDLWQRLAGAGARPSDRLREYTSVATLSSSPLFWHLRADGASEKEARAAVADAEMMVPAWLLWWYSGCPVLRLHDALTAPMLLTDVSGCRNVRWPWPAFCVDLGEDTPLQAAAGKTRSPRYIWFSVMRLARPPEGTGQIGMVDCRAIVAALDHPGRESVRACLDTESRALLALQTNASQFRIVLIAGRLPDECRIWWNDIVGDGDDTATAWAPEPYRDTQKIIEPLLVGPNIYRKSLDQPDYAALSAAKRLLINLALYFESIPKSDIVRVRHGSAITLARGRREVPPADRWIIGRGREIDIRIVEAARASVQSASGWHLSKRFVVRGHWRDQACGPGLSEHRSTWIRPYWKGPQDAEALVQAVTLKGASSN